MPWEKITSRRNPLLMHIRSLLASKEERDASGMYVCDGEKLLEEALLWKAPVEVLVATKPENLSHVPEGARLVQVPEDVMESISPMKSPQGVLLVCQKPEQKSPGTLTGSRYLLLDGVQDPGNVGTILRSADAFDCDGVLLIGACADPYHPKTARSTMGALFRRPVYSVSLEELKLLLQQSGFPLYGAALSDHTEDVRDVSLQHCVIAVGSEGKGLSPEVLDLCTSTVKIPMSERCESLNAAMAATLLLWEGYRKND